MTPIKIETAILANYKQQRFRFLTKTNQPIDVNVKVEKVNPQLEVIYYGTINLEKKGVEKTATRFNITQDGIVNVTGNLFKKLVPES